MKSLRLAYAKSATVARNHRPDPALSISGDGAVWVICDTCKEFLVSSISISKLGKIGAYFRHLPKRKSAKRIKN